MSTTFSKRPFRAKFMPWPGSPTSNRFERTGGKAVNEGGAHYLRSGNSFALWEADMSVLLDAEGMGDLIRPPPERDAFQSPAEAEQVSSDRKAKAFLWFSVSESLRRKHLLKYAGREARAADVYAVIRREVRPFDGLSWFESFARILVVLLMLAGLAEKGGDPIPSWILGAGVLTLQYQFDNILWTWNG